MVAERSAARCPGTGSGLQTDSSAPSDRPARMSGEAPVGAHWGTELRTPSGLPQSVVGVGPLAGVSVLRTAAVACPVGRWIVCTGWPGDLFRPVSSYYAYDDLPAQRGQLAGILAQVLAAFTSFDDVGFARARRNEDGRCRESEGDNVLGSTPFSPALHCCSLKFLGVAKLVEEDTGSSTSAPDTPESSTPAQRQPQPDPECGASPAEVSGLAIPAQSQSEREPGQGALPVQSAPPTAESDFTPAATPRADDNADLPSLVEESRVLKESRGLSLLEALGAFSALCGPPVAIVAIFDLPTVTKVLWSVIITVIAAVVVALWSAWRRNGRRLVGVALVLALLFNVGAVVGAAMGWKKATEATTLACLAPGERGGEYAEAFRAAYARKGGKDVLGCGISIVTPLAGGMHQNFTAPDGSPTVIFASETGAAVALDADEWAGYHSVRGPVETTFQAGFPFAESTQLSAGKVLEVGAGPGNWPRTAVVKKNGGKWYWIQEGMWPCYQARFGGPVGPLGYPTGSQEYDDVRRVVKQRFEGGELYYDERRGALTEAEFVAGISVACPKSEKGTPSDIYRVESTTGGIPHEINPNGYIDQTFTATTQTLSKLAVVVGLDPNSDTGGLHRLRFELRSDDTVMLRREATLVNNGWTTVSGDSIAITKGMDYTLRVVNSSPDVLGFYLNDENSAGAVGNRGCHAYLVGEKPKPAPHYLPSCLSALVQGN